MGGGKNKGPKKKKELHEYDERVEGTSLYTHIGLDSLRHHNIHTLDDDVVLTAAANTVLFANLTTGAVVSMSGPPDGGIGAVCAHPSRKLFVVCEKRPANPNVLVYEYPSKKLKYTMKKGAVLGFSCCTFNQDGSLLATVAMEPDYVLTLWNWKEEKIVLRNKAFGADVHDVQFSPFNPGFLITGGSGHIKFWSMATTFTGLKLQGDVGKFGRVEISDVFSSAAFPDGKVISGSESGMLLLWEGNLVKCQLGRAAAEEGQPVGKCHEGCIDVVKLIEDGRVILTGGRDGYLRYWLFKEADAAEGTGTDEATPLHCLKELYLGDNVGVVGLSQSADGKFWHIMDRSGYIRKAPYWGYELVRNATVIAEREDRPPLLAFNSGGIRAVAASPVDNCIITGGEDNSIRLQDFITKKELLQMRFDAPLRSVQFLPVKGDEEKRTYLCTFGDGAVRTVRIRRNMFVVVSQFRPHAEGIVCCAVDAKATQLYTVARDKSIFYSTIDDKGVVTPVGFCVLPKECGVPTTCEWTYDGRELLVGFPNGDIIALAAPDAAAIDPTEGFQYEPKWTAVGYRQKMKPPQKEKKKPTIGADGEEILGEESSSDDDDLGDEEADVGPWRVNFIRRVQDGLYAVGLEAPELTYLFKCSRRYPFPLLRPPPVPPSQLEPADYVEEPGMNIAFRGTIVRAATMSHTGQTLTLITEHGGVMMRRLAKLDKVVHATQLHDGVDGHITGATMSHDERLLLTAGMDGMLFAHAVATAEPPTAVDAVNLAKVPEAKGEEVVGPLAFENCLQAQKELDDRHAAEEAALGKRHATLKKIKAVHDEYNRILDENEKETGGRRVPDAEIELDPEVLADLEKQKEKAVEDARVDYLWVSARKKVVEDKLRAAMYDNLIWDRFMLHGFTNGITVASFRAAKFSEQQEKNAASVRALLEDEPEPASPTEGAASSTKAGSEPSGSPAGPASPKLSSPTAPVDPDVEGSFGGPRYDDPAAAPEVGASVKEKPSAVMSQLEKAEERRRERIERQKGEEALKARDPRNTPDDPVAVAEIEEAKRKMGNRILKSSKDYHIAADQMPNAESKAKQLVVLERSITQLRCDFNTALVASRDLKRDLVASMNKDRQRLREIELELDPGFDVESIPLFALRPEEEPEKRFDIDEEGLIAFGEAQIKEATRLAKLEKAKKGFGGDLSGGADEEEEAKAAEKAAAERAAAAAAEAARAKGKGHNQEARIEAEIDRARADNARQEVVKEETEMRHEALKYERGRLKRRIAKTIEAFDETVDELYHDKVTLEADLCMADMRVLLLYREFLMLCEFKSKDLQLQKRKAEEGKKVKDIRAKVDQCEERKNQNQAAQLHLDTVLIPALKVEYAELKSTISDAAWLAIERLYNKRIKRKRPGEDDDDDDDDESSSDDEEEEEDDEFADDGTEETCPAGCTEEQFRAVLALRDRKLDHDDSKADLKKAATMLAQDLSRLSRDLEEVKKASKAVEDDIAAFSVQKQRELNKLETIVVLKLSQIQCLTEDHKLPPKFDEKYIVFTKTAKAALRDRVKQLDREKASLAEEMAQLAKEVTRLERRRLKRANEFAEWDEKVKEVQLLKFGQPVNLEMLENVAVDRETEELKARLRTVELHWERELQRYNDKVTMMKEQYQKRISENTARLKDLGSLRADQRDLEEALVQSQSKIVAKMTGGSKVATAADRAHLKDLVVAQQQEIDALKNEIAMLRRKGGHVYTPVVNTVSAPHPPASA